MNNRKFNDIKRIAHEVRKWAEDYADVHVDESLSIDPTDLMGMCAIASARLFTRVQSAGYIEARLWSNDIHCFVTYQGWVIDVTATQFNDYTWQDYRNYTVYEKVHMAMIRECQEEWWFRDHEHTDAVALREFQVRVNWAEGQRVPEAA